MPAKKTPRLLEICHASASVADKMFSDVEVETLDFAPGLNPTHLHDIRKPLPNKLRNRYHYVYMPFVLERYSRNDVPVVTGHVVEALRKGGELWVVSFALEQLATMLRPDTPAYVIPFILPILYGTQKDTYDVNRSGHTLMMLRNLMGWSGLQVRDAYQQAHEVTMGDMKYTTIDNVVVAQK